jgi:hypothetical protein
LVALAANGNIAGALTLLNPKHWIREVAGIGERRQTIARESAAHEAEERVQIVSPANAEGRQLNTASATP